MHIKTQRQPYVKANHATNGARPGFCIGGPGRRPRVWAWGSWEGTTTPLPAMGSGGALWAPPAGFGIEPRPPKGFPLLVFLAIRMPYPDSVRLLAVDYHAAIRGRGSKTPPARDTTSYFWRRWSITINYCFYISRKPLLKSEADCCRSGCSVHQLNDKNWSSAQGRGR